MDSIDGLISIWFKYADCSSEEFRKFLKNECKSFRMSNTKDKGAYDISINKSNNICNNYLELQCIKLLKFM